MREKSLPDYILLAVVVALLLIGLLILSSVSAFLAEKKLANPYYFLLHQALFGVILGGILGFCFYKIPLLKIKRWSFILLLVNIFLLILVFVPGIGWKFGGAVRWLKIGVFSFQPSELLKITFPLYLAAWLDAKYQKRQDLNKKSLFKAKAKPKLNLTTLSEKFIPFLIILGGISIFLIFQPDISTLAVIAGVAILMYFIANTPLWHNILIGVFSILCLFLLIKTNPYRLSRLEVFLNPDIDPLGASYQIKQALIAIGSGGIFGRGLGLSQQKLGFLPQSLGDSIFAIFAEETGFLGALLLIFLFLIFLWRGLKIAKNSSNLFFKLLAFGITCQIILQALINIGALTGILPLTGIPLPFISYGGSHLVAELIAVGLLLNISKSD